MQYYKNSIRYAKFLLISVIFFAIYMTFFHNMVIDIITKNQNDIALQEQLLNVPIETQVQQEQSKEETEDEFVNRIFNEYKEKFPNMTAEKKIEVQDIIRNKYRTMHNLEPIEVRYAQNQQEEGIPKEEHQYTEPQYIEEPQHTEEQYAPQEENVQAPPEEIPQEPPQENAIQPPQENGEQYHQ